MNNSPNLAPENTNAFFLRVPSQLLKRWKSAAKKAGKPVAMWIGEHLDRAAESHRAGIIRLPTAPTPRAAGEADERIRIEAAESRFRAWNLAAIEGPQPKTLEEWAIDSLAATPG